MSLRTTFGIIGGNDREIFFPQICVVLVDNLRKGANNLQDKAKFVSMRYRFEVNVILLFLLEEFKMPFN